jgi:hypothetical protein
MCGFCAVALPSHHAVARRRIAVTVASPSRRHIASLNEAHATSILQLNRIDPLLGEEVEPQQRALRGATMSLRALVC